MKKKKITWLILGRSHPSTSFRRVKYNIKLKLRFFVIGMFVLFFEASKRFTFYVIFELFITFKRLHYRLLIQQ